MSININHKRPLRLFEGYGVEMEYMIVNQNTLDILPISDRLLEKAAGKIVNEVSQNGTAWSNELVLHVIEIKTNGPSTELKGLGESFQNQANEINRQLLEFNAKLMPGAIHPWMDPFNEIKLWPHEYNPIYESYNRIFDCRGHGWANVQSTHLNLPFYGDDDFEKLHASVRLILPLIPALAASSPIADGKITPWLNFRMEAYRTNSLKIPSVTGKIIPEQVFTEADYREQIFDTMYRDIAPYDKDGILQDEWLNSRGAMSRWDRHAIEIRVIDIQENPVSDIAILEWVVNLAKALVSADWCSLEEQKSWHEDDLYDILMSTIKYGEKAEIQNERYLSLFGVSDKTMQAGELSRFIFKRLESDFLFTDESKTVLNLIFEEGPLARRILNALPPRFTRKELFDVYAKLTDCLKRGISFVP